MGEGKRERVEGTHDATKLMDDSVPSAKSLREVEQGQLCRTERQGERGGTHLLKASTTTKASREKASERSSPGPCALAGSSS